MNSNLIDSPSQTITEPKQIFNSIDEYESHLNDNIKDSLSVFVNVINSGDIHKKISSLVDIKKELNISHNLETLLYELGDSKSALDQIEDTIKKKFRRKRPKKNNKEKSSLLF